MKGKGVVTRSHIRVVLLVGLLYSIVTAGILIALSPFMWQRELLRVIDLTAEGGEVYEALMKVISKQGIEEAWITVTPRESFILPHREGPGYRWLQYLVRVEIPPSFRALSAGLLEPLFSALEDLHGVRGDLLEIREGGDEGRREVFARVGLEAPLKNVLAAVEVCQIEMTQEGVLPFAALSGKRGRLGIIIDDVGYRRVGVEGFVQIGRPLNFSILPHAPWAQQEAKAALEAGYLIMLHQPMEPLDTSIEVGDDAITTGMEDGDIISILEGNLSLLPGVEGVNNHMGSRVTADEGIMRRVLRVIKEKGLFFVDSRTSPASLAFEVGKDMGVPTVCNSSFIDNENGVEQIKGMIRSLGRRALRRGSAIGIGHDRPATFEALSQMIEELETAGIELVYIRELLPQTVEEEERAEEENQKPIYN